MAFDTKRLRSIDPLQIKPAEAFVHACVCVCACFWEHLHRVKTASDVRHGDLRSVSKNNLEQN